ncbi:MAG: glycoside hydrolase family 1 protein, partial [Thermoanaerobaculia bacterium]
RRPFLWGAATSSYQVEGGPDSDWARWERDGKLRARHERCGEASGHGRLWESDYALLASLGVNAYRFSIEWSRVEPVRGRFSLAALEECRRRVDRLIELGIEPVLTLFHYTHPSWFGEFGWETRAGVERFLEFVKAVADAVGDRVSTFTILNEPVVFILGGYLDGRIPPGLRDFASASRAMENLLRAHAEAAAILREKSPGARFGIAHNMMDFAPGRRASWADRRLASAADRFYNRAYLEAAVTGRLDMRIPMIGRIRASIPELPSATDFIGVNYYSRLHLQFPGRSGWKGEFFYRDAGGRGLTDTGWEVHPEGLVSCLRTAAETDLPVLVTENGIATRDDRLRCDFLREHVALLSQARDSGLPLAGYFYWSLLDNFEWLEGFSPRFGLIDVDYATFARRRRPSAALFAELGARFLHTGFTSR